MDVITPCTDNPELFFSEDAAEIEQAKDQCHDCPLFLGCREKAFDFEYGVMGGLSPQDREQMDPARVARLRRDRMLAQQAMDNAIKAARPVDHPMRDEVIRLSDQGLSAYAIKKRLGIGYDTVTRCLRAA